MHQLFIYIILHFTLFFSSMLMADTSFRLEAKEKGSIQKFQNKTALEKSQAAIGNQLSNFYLTDANGRGVKLHDLLGKPLVLSLVYTSCYQTCPVTTRHLSSVVEKARKALGKDNFSVAVLGFDSQSDSPQAMKFLQKNRE